MSSGHTHLYQIDLIRLISILAIIIIHTSSVILEQFPSIPQSSLVFSLILSSAFRWGTPLFIMISGYLLFNSQTLSEPKKFYTRRLKKIIIPLIFWNIFYYILNIPHDSGDYNIQNFWLNFISGGTYHHLYFLFLILGLYLITPLLKTIIKRLEINIFFLIGYTILAYLYLITTYLLKWYQPDSSFDIFLSYIGYYLAGYWFINHKLKIHSGYLLIGITAISLGIFINYHQIIKTGVNDISLLATHRLSPPIIFLSFIIFPLLINLKLNLSQKIQNILPKLADLCFGVYLIHPVVIRFLSTDYWLSNFLNFHPNLWIIATLPITAISSFIIVASIKKVPILNKII